MLNEIIQFDISLFYFINKNLSAPWLDPLMLLISEDIWWGALAFFGFLLSFSKWWRPIRRWMIVSFISIAIADSFSFRLLKPYFKRYRPCYQLADVRLVPDSCGGFYGFPSNHAANSMAVAAVSLVFLRPRYFLAFLGLAISVGISRIYLGVHFPMDVLVGFLAGFSSGLMTALLWKKYEQIIQQRWQFL